MKTIHKYQLSAADEQEIPMPVNAQILSVQMQDGIACLWAVVDTCEVIANRKIHIRGTGHSLGNVGRYISTFQLAGGRLVFHAFEGVQ